VLIAWLSASLALTLRRHRKYTRELDYVDKAGVTRESEFRASAITAARQDRRSSIKALVDVLGATDAV
jgi:hypothetical protein